MKNGNLIEILTLSSCLGIRGPFLILAPKNSPLSSLSEQTLVPLPRISCLSIAGKESFPFLWKERGVGMAFDPSVVL